MCLKMFLVVLFIYIRSFSSVAQQHNYCQKVQINNSKMYGECCVFLKVDNADLEEKVEEALLKSSLIRESQPNNDFKFHNPNGSVKSPQYHRNNRPPPDGAEQKQLSSNNKDAEDLHPLGSSLLPNIREKPNNQFDNPIIMKFQSNDRGTKNPKENFENRDPENLQSEGHFNRKTAHRGASRPTHHDIRPNERESTPPLVPIDQQGRDFPPHSHKRTPIIENSMTKSNRVRPQDTPLIMNEKGPEYNAKTADNFHPNRQDNIEMSDNYQPRSQGNPEITRLPEDFEQRRPQDNPSLEHTMPIINDDSAIPPNQKPFTTQNNVQRPNPPPLQRNPQKSNVNAEKKVSVSTSGTTQSTIKSTTEDDSSDIVFLPDEHPTEVPKVTENANVTANVSGVVVDNRNAVGVPNERVLPNGDQATEF